MNQVCSMYFSATCVLLFPHFSWVNRWTSPPTPRPHPGRQAATRLVARVAGSTEARRAGGLGEHGRHEATKDLDAKWSKWPGASAKSSGGTGVAWIFGFFLDISCLRWLKNCCLMFWFFGRRLLLLMDVMFLFVSSKDLPWGNQGECCCASYASWRPNWATITEVDANTAPPVQVKSYVPGDPRREQLGTQYCAAASIGCHGIETSDHRLARHHVRGLWPGLYVQQNLHGKRCCFFVVFCLEPWTGLVLCGWIFVPLDWHTFGTLLFTKIIKPITGTRQYTVYTIVYIIQPNPTNDIVIACDSALISRCFQFQHLILTSNWNEVRECEILPPRCLKISYGFILWCSLRSTMF